MRAISGCVLVLLAIALAPAGVKAAPEPFDGRLTGGVVTHVVARGETLTGIGARYGVGLEALAADNALASDARLREGQRLVVDNRHIVPQVPDAGRLLVNLPQRMLFFVDDDSAVVGLPIAAGRRSWPTPVGPFTIASKREHPAWHVPASILAEARRQGRDLPAVVPPGPDNPLGAHWLGLSVPGYGIHGTNAPASIHQLVTHGCIRLHPDDVSWLFPRVAIGEPGRVVYEPVLLAVVDGRVYLERHRDVYGLGGDALATARRLAAESGVHDRVDWVRVATVIAAQHGVARDVTAAPSGANVAPPDTGTPDSAPLAKQSGDGAREVSRQHEKFPMVASWLSRRF
jgi:L,D-transpeptidase ErfK/SrfK